jgi:hypothetical protein
MEDSKLETFWRGKVVHEGTTSLVLIHTSETARRLDSALKVQTYWNREEQEARKSSHVSIHSQQHVLLLHIHHTVQFVAISAISLSLSLPPAHPLNF